ncbi:hypothetical protein GCM10009504_22800 [Pseudomonas laurentiana]|uniref:Uncharacterized protein n=1 Tax=Pseudomonas laurentiana TaxID=2364649 RepID=A0A6I5RTA7_9PSED|nr:hypothetical protein [Pseudomonas laurentiana]NES10588.1 hypothetical protein [Pseudomonas laurentiana]GGU65278.1 hypothetical protein GCM10009504_22800 [Pseudomonas laurentiana]
MATEMHLRLVVSLLRRGRDLDRFSTVLTVLALLVGLAPLCGVAPSLFAALLAVLLLLCGLIQKYFALRVALDADLFACMTAPPHAFDLKADALDNALHELGLQPAATVSRSLFQRSRGALRLLRFQALCVCAQCLIVLLACLCMPWLSLIA